MNELYTWKNKIAEIYGAQSKAIEMVGRLLISLLVFFYINNHIAYMSILSKGFVVIGLSAVCALLPLVFLGVLAIIVIIAHVFSLSMVLAGCVAVVFLMMFIVYFRFTSDMISVALLTPIALVFNIPYALPVACGLLFGPTAAIPMACGVITYYLIEIIQVLSTSETVGVLSADGVMADVLGLLTELIDCKEMIFYIAVLSVGVWVVTGVRRLHMDHAWKIATASGVLFMIVTAMITSSVLEVALPMMSLLLGSLVACLVGLVIEFLFLSVSYSKTEYLEFQDDDYYYCVKAVPRNKGTEDSKKQVRKRRVEEESLEEEFLEEELLEDELLDMELLQDDDMLEDELFEDELYLEDSELSLKDATMVLETDEIERELRSHAHRKATGSHQAKKNHAKTNFRMLKDSVDKELKRK